MPVTVLEKLGRLPEMGVGEIGYRLQESLRKNLDRARRRLREDDADLDRFVCRVPGDPERSRHFLEYLETRAAERFYPSTFGAGRDRVRDTILRRLGRREEIDAEAERILDHRLECLGHGEVPCGSPIDWHRDPVGGERWERRFWADYDLVHERGAGDPKRVLELNRHQHLVRLGRAYLVTGDERYAREVVDQMLDWIDQNPPGLGVNWHCSLEISLRSLSWLWALFLVLPSGAVDEETARRLGRSLFAQIDHVHRFPSVVSSPNTHLLGEATALFLAGSVFHDCEGADDWRETGARILTEEIDRQILPDGVHGELSTSYHAYALDFYLQALSLARTLGRPFSLPVRRGVERMLDFLLHVARPDGTLPRLGDDDGGRALPFGSAGYDRVDGLLAIGAVLYRRQDLKARAGDDDEVLLWLLGPEGEDELQALPAGAPKTLQASFPDAGYFVHRSGWGREDAQLVFDCGGLGTLGGGHGHADALSITLSAGGEAILVDPGTFVYNGAPEWRDGLRSTRAHNTAVVDGRSQSEASDTFRWRTRARVELLHDATFEGLELVAGEHRGYAEGEDPVIHRRRVLFVRPHYWLVLDDFRGRGDHEIELPLHFAPGIGMRPLPASGSRATRWFAENGRGSLRLSVHASRAIQTCVHEGGDDPATGWVSRRYGEKRPAPTLVLRLDGPVPVGVATVLAPGGSGPIDARPLRVRAEGAALGLEIEHDQGVDLAILSPGAEPVETGDVRCRGEAFWARFQAGELRRLLAIDGRSFAVGGRPALSGNGPITDFAVDAAPNLDRPEGSD